MTATFTARSVKTLPAPPVGRIDYFDAKLPGFGLRVSAGGSRVWFVLYRIGGHLKRFTIGPATVYDLEAPEGSERPGARELARDLLHTARRGTDPAIERRVQREAAKAETVDRSFQTLADRFLEYAKIKKRSWHADELKLRRDILPVFGTKLAREVGASDVKVLLSRIKKRNAPMTANRTFALVRRIFSFGLEDDELRERFGLAVNPCTGLAKSLDEERSRDRVLKVDEIRVLWRALDSEPPDAAAIFKLYLLTLQRGGEIRSMERKDVDLDGALWTIPAHKAKNGLAHDVPLSADAVAIIREQTARHSSSWVFPAAPTATRGSSVSPHRQSLWKARLRLRRATGIDFRPHDLRRTGTTHLAEMGVDLLTLKRLLNHTDRKDVTFRYERYDRAREKRAALDAWARRLHAILTGETAPKVVPLRSA